MSEPPIIFLTIFSPGYYPDVPPDSPGLHHTRGAVHQEDSGRGVRRGHHAGPALRVGAVTETRKKLRNLRFIKHCKKCIADAVFLYLMIKERPIILHLKKN